MNREEYRKAVDQLSFSADFQPRTEALLRQRARELEKEKPNMHFKKTRKLAVLIAAAVALLAVSVSAAVLFLQPADVAERFEDPTLAAAFRSEDAVLVNETVQAGGYDITLMGLVSGEGIGKWYDEAEPSRTYAVVSVARADGTPLTDDNYDVMATGTFTISPLVAGYAPQAVNAWTLNGGCGSFLENGVAYYLLDTLDIQMFADHTVYMAVYQGFVPSYDMFSVAEDGAYSLRSGVTGALFTLPLDANLADPEATRAFVEGTGMAYEPMTDAERAALPETAAPAVTESEGEDGEKLVTIGGPAAQAEGELKPFTAETFKAYLAAETEKLDQQLADGVLSQENFDKTVAELEATLAGLKDGTLVAFLDGDSLVTGTASNGEYDFQYGKTEDGGVSVAIADAG